jgi:PAS domain S-box-containing protein
VVNVVMQPYRDAAGRVDGLLIHGVDVTEEVRAREALLDNERRLAAIVELVAVGIAQTDLDGRFVLVNDRYCKIVGRSRAELLSGLRMQDLTHPDDLPRNVELFDRLIREGEPFVIEERYVRPNGTEVCVRNTVSRVDDAAGMPRFVLATSEELPGTD